MSRARRKDRHVSRLHRLDCLEQRIMLSAIGTATSSAASIGPLMFTWNQSGQVDGVIAKGLYSTHDHHEITDENGTHISDSLAEPYTEGVNPGWLSGIKLTASSHNATSITNGGAYPTVAMSSAYIDFLVSVRQIAPLPGGFPTSTFNIPVKSEFWIHTDILGTAGLTFASGTADAYVETCLSGGAQYHKEEVDLDWIDDQAMADNTGRLLDEKAVTFSNTVAYSPVTHGSDYVSIHYTAAGSSQVAAMNSANLTLDSAAYAVVTNFAFDQAAFDLAQGARSFVLSDYFELVYGWDPSIPVPTRPGSGGVVTTPVICSTPDLVDTSDTGTSNSDNLTGDLTPTFTGTVFSGTKPLKSGIVTLYMNGTQVGTGAVVNGAYRVTCLTPLSEGGYAVTAAMATTGSPGPQSSALNIVIDSDLARGDSLTATIGSGGVKAVRFTDSDGTVATIKLGSGQATLALAGEALNTTLGRDGTLAVTGIGVSLGDVSVTGDTTGATLAFSLNKPAGSDGQLDLHSLSVAGPIKAIAGKGVNLSGDLTVGGALQSLTLNDISGDQHTLSLGGTAADKAATLVLGTVEDTTLTAGSPIASLTVQAWTDDQDPADVITTSSIGKLTAKGAFAAGLTLSGTAVPANKAALGVTKIGGRITGGTWTVHGASDAISAVGIASDWEATFEGAIKSLTTTSTTSGTITALSIGTMKVTGTLDGATIRLTQAVDPLHKIKALGSLTVSGLMNDSTIDAEGDIGPITVARFLGSSVFAGVNTAQNALGTLPDAASDFDAQAQIGTFTIKGISGQVLTCCQESYLAAATLGAVTLRDLPQDGSAEGGVAAITLLRSYTQTLTGLGTTTSKGPLTGARTLQQLDDFLVRLV